MEQFFVAEGLPHLMFYYQDTEPVEAGNIWNEIVHLPRQKWMFWVEVLYPYEST